MDTAFTVLPALSLPAFWHPIMDSPILTWLLFRVASSLVVFTTVGGLLLAYHRRPKGPKHPQDAPNGLPLLGHAISFSNDMAGFTMKLKKRFNGIPFRLRLVVMNVVMLTEPEHVNALYRRSTELTNGPYRKFVSSTFGVPKEFQKFFAADNSGLSRTPLPGSNVKAEHRVDYLMHSFIVQFMTGKSLKTLAHRFTHNMEARLRLRGSAGWSAPCDNLYDFIKTNMFHASVKAMFGTRLFELDPDFCEHFWEFEEGMPELAKGLPRWIYPKQYRARNVCLATVQKWQQNLQQRRNQDADASHELEAQDYDDFFGSSIVKKRHAAFAKMEVMGTNARASEDLALIWGSNSNATHAAFWLIYSVLEDAATTQRFLAEIREAEHRDANSGFAVYDMDALCANPFLQSLYAETLRLYVANIVLRSPRNADMKLGEWSIRRGEIIATMSYPMHQDEAKFNVGTPQDPRPLSSFWAERFLVPDVAVVEGKTSSSAASQPRRGVKFSLAGTEGAYTPYGFGSNMCPGRYFAKQEMLLTAALLIGNYEVELVGAAPEVDWRYFGSGVLGVKGRQAFRMRPRAVQAAGSSM